MDENELREMQKAARLGANYGTGTKQFIRYAKERARTGTSYFITFERAVRYYHPYCPGATREEITRWVAHKVASDEIHIGPPPIKLGERHELDEDGRYEIVTPEG